jgi:hypothetical protein
MSHAILRKSFIHNVGLVEDEIFHGTEAECDEVLEKIARSQPGTFSKKIESYFKIEAS